MPFIRPLHQLTPREHETLKNMDILADIYPNATGDWALDSRSPLIPESELPPAPVVREPTGRLVRERQTVVVQ